LHALEASGLGSAASRDFNALKRTSSGAGGSDQEEGHHKKK